MGDPDAMMNASVLGRLLEEISWEGSRVRNYRQGGRGYENVLTAEVLGPLRYLPRAFLAAVIEAAHGADLAREVVAGEAEEAEIVLLPEETQLAEGGTVVQPDGLLTTPRTRVLIEAKGMGPSAFQREQLSREYVCAVRDAGTSIPLLLLILPIAPPVAVKGHGRQSVEAAIVLYLESVVDRTTGLDRSLDELVASIPEVVAWTTWRDIQTVVSRTVLDHGAPDTMIASVERLRSDLIQAVDWHSRGN